MRKLRWPAAAAFATVLVGVVAFPVGSQQPPQRTTLTFFDPNKTNWEKVVDHGRKGGSAGDEVLFVEAQLDPDTCERVGRLVGHIAISKTVGSEDAWFIGDFTLVLADGKVTAAGAAKFSEFAQQERGVFVVTGGTGAYRDATGEVFFEEDVELCDRRGTLTRVDIVHTP